jgi:hypothetical protein
MDYQKNKIQKEDKLAKIPGKAQLKVASKVFNLVS